MGVELAHQFNVEVQEMEDVNFTDSELVYHVRDALISVQSVSFLLFCAIHVCLFVFLLVTVVS